MARPMKVLAIWATSLVLLSALIPLVGAIPVLKKENELTMWQGSDPAPEYQEGTEYKDIFLYFHKTSTSGQYILNTVGGSNGVDVLPSASSVLFRLEDHLTRNLKVVGHEIDATKKGFWLDLSVTTALQASVTIQVLDEDLVVANKTMRFQGTEDRWNIPFVGGAESHTFPKGNRIGVRISTTGSTSISYASNDKLWVLSEPSTLNADIYNANGVKTKTFQPNDVPSERFVDVKGKISDPWGAGDISSVTVEILDPSDISLVNGTATLDGMNFTYEWNYSAGQSAGSYQVIVTMQDQQSNLYFAYNDFTMATYGVHLDSPQAREAGLIEGSVEKGGCIEYSVSVLNTGAAATSYTLSQSSSDVSGWSLSITPSQTGTVQPGESKIVMVKVCADDEVEEGTQAVFYVTAVAAGDPTAKDTIQILTSAVPKINLSLRWTTPTNTCTNLVNTGGNVSCSFEIKNSGLSTLNVSVSMEMTKGSPDWTATVSPSSIISNNLQLYAEQTVGGTLSIRAPSDPSKINESIINIRASTNDEPPLNKLISATTIMSTGISLEVVGGDLKEIDADEAAEFYIIVSNTDPNNDHSITMSTTASAGWTVDFVASSRSFSLNAQESKTVNIKVTPATSAPAGTYNVDVTGMYQDNPSTWDKVSLSVRIKERHELTLTVTPVKKTVGAEEGASFTVEVENKGNVDEKTASLVVSPVSGDLKAEVEIDSVSDNALSTNIPRGDTVTFTVKITPKKDAVHKDKGTWKLTINGLGGASDSKTVQVVLEKDTEQLLEEVMGDYQIWILVALVIVVVVFFIMVRRR